MTPRSKPPEELLSACHDGETTPAERTEIERLLAESPAHQETLDDFRELTAVLQSLPRPAAPAHLQVDVLRRVRAATAERLQQQASRRRPWWWSLSLAATAALLFLLVRGPAPQVGPVDVATSTPASKSLATNDRSAFSDEAAAVNELREPAAPPMVLEATDDRAAGSPFAGSTPAPPPMPRAAAPADAPPPVPAPIAAAPALPFSTLSGEALSQRLNLDATSPPRGAEILAYMQEVGNQVVLVEFDVVNVDQTAADFLVLLRRRGVTVVDSTDATVAAEAGLAAKSLSGAAADELVALYVEATESQLAAVVDEFITQTAVTEGSLHNAEVAGPLLSSRLQRIVTRAAAAPVEGSAPRRGAMAPSPSAAVANAEPAPTAESGRLVQDKTTTATAAAAAVDPPLPQGVRLAITREAIRDIERRAEYAETPINASGAIVQSTDVAPQPRRTAAAVREASPAGAPTSGPAEFRRVLFVLQPKLND